MPGSRLVTLIKLQGLKDKTGWHMGLAEDVRMIPVHVTFFCRQVLTFPVPARNTNQIPSLPRLRAPVIAEPSRDKHCHNREYRPPALAPRSLLCPCEVKRYEADIVQGPRAICFTISTTSQKTGGHKTQLTCLLH